ncbi:glycerol-3-phosphate dehydrogenase subunit GlpB [Sesbania bispinosa]|nr:glycerol-3-phosphate dehydrogenase subunit GlpB [Sesbania bispinosa]
MWSPSLSQKHRSTTAKRTDPPLSLRSSPQIAHCRMQTNDLSMRDVDHCRLTARSVERPPQQ